MEDTSEDESTSLTDILNDNLTANLTENQSQEDIAITSLVNHTCVDSSECDPFNDHSSSLFDHKVSIDTDNRSSSKSLSHSDTHTCSHSLDTANNASCDLQDGNFKKSSKNNSQLRFSVEPAQNERPFSHKGKRSTHSSGQSSSHSPSHTRSHSAGHIPLASLTNMANGDLLSQYVHRDQSKSDIRSQLNDKQSFGDLDSSNSDVNTSLAFRPFMSFSRLVSGHTLGDEEEVSISSEPGEHKIFQKLHLSKDKHHKHGSLIRPSQSCDSSPRQPLDNSKSRDRSPRPLLDKPTSQSASYSRLSSMEINSSLKRLTSDLKSVIDSNKSSSSRRAKYSRTAKEIDHWLEYQKKYGNLPKHQSVETDTQSLKDITNVSLRLGSDPPSSESTPRSDTKIPSSLRSFTTSSMEASPNMSHITGSHVSGAKQWSSNMSDILKRKQELEEEIRKIEDNSYDSPRSNVSATGDCVLDESFERSEKNYKDNLTVCDIRAHHSKHNLSPRAFDYLKPESGSRDNSPRDANTSHDSDISRDTSPRDISRTVSSELLRKRSPKAGRRPRANNVMGKPPVHPKRGIGLSLREVSEDHFPGAPQKQPSDRHSTHTSPKQLRRSAPLLLTSSPESLTSSDRQLPGSGSEKRDDSVVQSMCGKMSVIVFFYCFAF